MSHNGDFRSKCLLIKVSKQAIKANRYRCEIGLIVFFTIQFYNPELIAFHSE